MYGPHLTTSVIEDQIYPQLQVGLISSLWLAAVGFMATPPAHLPHLSYPTPQTGFTDGNAYIRELTLKSMLALAPRMSNKTLTQNVLKHLSKLQVRGGLCKSVYTKIFDVASKEAISGSKMSNSASPSPPSGGRGAINPS